MAFSSPAFSPISHSTFITTRIRATNSNHRMLIPNVLGNEILDKMGNRRFRKLKEAKIAFRKVLEEGKKDLSLESLGMIDSVQRLGIDYHFKEEIKQILENHYKSDCINQNHDLSLVALQFRLLRQHGLYVPADVFDKFRNKDGMFKQELGEDIKGLMELYEASQLCIEGEDILDEARVFSSRLLSASTLNLDDGQARIVLNTLKNPHHRTLARPLVRNYLQNFKAGKNESQDLFTELGQLDFNMLQSFHRYEIVQVSKWWRNNIGMAAEMKLASEQPVEWFSWTMGTLSDPNLSEQRLELAKVVSVFYFIQDVFHFYFSVDQLSLFVQAVHRWDISTVSELPEYMKICLKALYDITDEIAYKVYNQSGYNPKRSFRKAWTELCQAFLGEAKWAAVGQLPKAECYLKIANGTSAVNVVLVHIFFLLGQNLTRNTINLIDNHPQIFSSAASIFLLSNDLKVKDEDQDDRLSSYMKCYLREYPLSSIQEAKMNAVETISNTWKQLNMQCFSSNQFSESFTMAALNCARLAPLVNVSSDSHHPPGLKETMKSLLFQRITV